jgi:hypothetical protein
LNFQLTLAVDWFVPSAPIVGPFVAMTPALQLKLQPMAPVVNVNLNLELQIGIQLNVWQFNLQASFDLANLTWTIYHSVAQTTAPNLPPAVATSPYQFQLSADGGAGPYSWSLPTGSGAPSWLSISPGGAVSGTPPAPATATSFTVAVTDSNGDTATATDAIVVDPAVALLTTSLPDATVGQPYTYYLRATGGTAPYTYSASGLPSWITLNSGTGSIQGTPPSGTTGQAYSISVTVTDSTSPTPTHDGPHTLTLTVAPMSVTTTSLPVAEINQPYNTTLTAGNGVAPYSWAFDPSFTPPSWLSLSSSGTLSGTPPAQAQGTAITLTVDVTDSATPADTASATLVLTVSPWTVTVLSANNNLDSVSCPSATACMALGSNGSQPFAEEWNGNTWTQLTMPSPPGVDPAYGFRLREVSCTSISFCMAVGWATYDFPGAPCRICDLPLAEAWNGSQWTIVANPPGLISFAQQTGNLDLFWVSCTSDTFCMATGDAAGGGQSYAEQWDGSQWLVDPIPTPYGTDNYGTYRNGVSCTSPQFCVTVGVYNTAFNPGLSQPLIEQWDGHTWSIVKGPSVTGGDLWDVSCSTPASCLATDVPDELWDGSNWSLIPSVGGRGDVSCVASTDCVVDQPIARWNGAYWSGLSGPLGSWSDISCAAANFCVAVGSQQGSEPVIATYQVTGTTSPGPLGIATRTRNLLQGHGHLGLVTATDPPPR